MMEVYETRQHERGKEDHQEGAGGGEDIDTTKIRGPLTVFRVKSPFFMPFSIYLTGIVGQRRIMCQFLVLLFFICFSNELN
jgi:hypothetical protein